MGLLDKVRPAGQPAGGAIDPVCHMTVDPARAAGKSVHGGATYFFCSAGCKAKFDADPHKYLGAHGHGGAHEHHHG
jgi:Cu+-exporting ATPase